jgi:hypothetical protein
MYDVVDVPMGYTTNRTHPYGQYITMVRIDRIAVSSHTKYNQMTATSKTIPNVHGLIEQTSLLLFFPTRQWIQENQSGKCQT